MSDRPPQAGPPLVVPAVVAAALTVVSVVLFSSGPRPTTSASDVLAYTQSHTTRLHVVAFLVFGVSMPLAVLSASLYRRLRRLGVTAPGAAITLAGGVLASAALALSGLLTWVAASTADDLEAPLAKVLFQLSFAAGGTGFAAPLGLALAGLAVPALVLRLVPRPLAAIGLALGTVGAVSTATLLTGALDPLLPITRFGGLAWLIVMAVVLPATRVRTAGSAA